MFVQAAVAPYIVTAVAVVSVSRSFVPGLSNTSANNFSNPRLPHSSVGGGRDQVVMLVPDSEPEEVEYMKSKEKSW